MVLEDSIEATKRGNQSIVLSICDSYKAQQWYPSKIFFKGTVVKLILGVINSYLIEYKANRREIAHGTGNPPNYLGLVKLWILEESPLPALY